LRINGKHLSTTVVVLVLIISFAFFGLAEAKIKIRYRHWGNNPWIEATVAAFNASQDQIEVEFEPQGHHDKLTLELAAGTAPEVFSTGSFPGYGLPEWVPQGFLLDLGPYIERDAAEMNLSDIPQAIKDLAMSDMKGHWYGFPFITYLGDIVWYNKTLFNEAGILVPTDDWSLGDFISIAKKMTADEDGDGTPDRWGASNSGAGYIKMKNGLFYNKEGTEFLYNDPALKRGVRFMYEVYNTYGIATPVGSPSIESGKLAMLLGRSNMIYFIGFGLDAGFEYGTVQWPWDPDSGTRGAQIADDSNYLSIKADISPEKAEAAWKFLKFFVTKPGVKAAYEAVGVLQIPPPYVSLIEEYYLHPTGKHENLDLSVFVRNIPLLIGHPNRPRAHLDEIGKILQWNQVISGEKAPGIFLQEVGPAINALLAEIGDTQQ